MEYREHLNFSKELPFGVEIEISNKTLNDLDAILKEKQILENRKTYIELEKQFGKKRAEEIYYKGHFAFRNKKEAYWLYQYEDTNEENKNLGVEIISPILHNEKQDLKNLKMVLKFLQSIHAEVNESCGVHIHMGASSFQGDLKKLYHFFLFYLYFEPVFYKLSAMGNFGHVREYAYAFANPVVLNLKGLVNPKTMETYIKENASSIHKENGLHFKGFSFTNFGYGSSFEVRIFNGTINECIIENYINVTLSSLAYALSNSFKEEIYQKRCDHVLNVRKNWHTFEKFVAGADALVDEFVNTIFKYSIDKDSFFEQYKGLCLQKSTK